MSKAYENHGREVARQITVPLFKKPDWKKIQAALNAERIRDDMTEGLIQFCRENDLEFMSAVELRDTLTSRDLIKYKNEIAWLSMWIKTSEIVDRLERFEGLS